MGSTTSRTLTLVCPSRREASNAAANGCQGRKVGTEVPKSRDAGGGLDAAPKLPRQKLRIQLKNSVLSHSAEVFVPAAQAHAHPAAAAFGTRVAGAVSAVGTQPGHQGSSSVGGGSSLAGYAGAPQVLGDAARARVGASVAGARWPKAPAVPGAADSDGGAAGEFKINPGEYLSLLSAGNKAKPPNQLVQRTDVVKAPRRAPLPVVAPKQFVTTGRASASGSFQDSFRPTKSAGGEPAISPSAISLGELWAQSFKGKAANPKMPNVYALTASSATADGACRGEPRTQDDTLVERLNEDADVSEACYWSDSEPVAYIRVALGSERRRRLHTMAVRNRNSLVGSYVMQDLSAELDALVAMALRRTQILGERHKLLVPATAVSDGSLPQQGVGGAGASEVLAQQQQTGATRRFVVGLKEVFRRVKQSKVKILIVAPDIEQDPEIGGISDRVREVLAYAYETGVTVIFALSRASIGRSIGKTLNVSLVGIMDDVGTKALFQQARTVAEQHRQAWLDRYTTKSEAPKNPKRRSSDAPRGALDTGGGSF